MPTAHREQSGCLPILVVCASPVDIRPALNLAEEWNRLAEEVRRSIVPIELRRVFRPTFEQLKRELAPHALIARARVFHFLGHGEEDGLWFENEEGAKDLISGVRLRALLRHSAVELAVLNACWTATSRVLSLCDQLVRDDGITAALGHGQPVADKSAILFASRLYALLASGAAVDSARQQAANHLSEQGLPGTTEIQLKGDFGLRLCQDVIGSARPGRVVDSLPVRGFLPGAGPFFGRTEQLLKISRTLADCGCCGWAIWGLGGIGKTRLALEIARRNAWRYRAGGVVWVDARDVSPPTTRALVRLAVARLRIPESGDPIPALLNHLSGAPGLLVLDNLEVLPAGEQASLARVVHQLPRNGSRALVTARTQLDPFEKLADAQSLTLTSGLDDWSGADFAYRVACNKDVKPLQEAPREENGRIEGVCAGLSRRVSGHPRMIEIGVGIARKGLEAMDQALEEMHGDLETQLQELLETGLGQVDADGKLLLRCLPFFPTGRFMAEAMQVVWRALCPPTSTIAPLEQETDDAEKAHADDAEVDDPDPHFRSTLRQLERSGFLGFDQTADVYTFHQTLLDYAARQPPVGEDQGSSALSKLLMFYARYLARNEINLSAIDRCFEDVIIHTE